MNYMMNSIFMCFDIPFTFIWKFQIKIMQLSYHLKPKIEKIISNNKVRAVKKILLVLLGLTVAIFGCFKSYKGFLISGIIFFCYIYLLDIFENLSKYIITPFTSLRMFIIASILINFFISIIVMNYTKSLYVFPILFIIINLIANTKVAKTCNAIIEISLGVISLIKTPLAYFICNKQFPSILDYHINNYDLFSYVENVIVINMDIILFPLLVINGIALLICEIHSYWIDKYNGGKEITHDIKKLKEYIKK